MRRGAYKFACLPPPGEIKLHYTVKISKVIIHNLSPITENMKLNIFFHPYEYINEYYFITS